MVEIKKEPKPILGLEDKCKEFRSTINLKTFEVIKKQQDVNKTNARAISFLYCVVSGLKYKKILICETKEDMWGKFQVTYEDTTKVK